MLNLCPIMLWIMLHNVAYAHVQQAYVQFQNGMVDAEDLGDSEIEPVPVTPPSCDHPELFRTSILAKLKLPMKLDLARKRK